MKISAKKKIDNADQKSLKVARRAPVPKKNMIGGMI
jgi:hypothetical protein